MREVRREQYSYQSSSAAKFTALSSCVENKSICDTKSLMIALSISLTRSLKIKTNDREETKTNDREETKKLTVQIMRCVTKLSNCVPTEWINVALSRKAYKQCTYPNYLENSLRMFPDIINAQLQEVNKTLDQKRIMDKEHLEQPT